MFNLKPISKEAVSAALQKAERYRLINNPWAAESICLDILEIDSDNQQALTILLLAITDQFRDQLADGVERVRKVLPRIRDEYKRVYYTGMICERRGKAQLDHGGPGAGSVAYEWFREAMSWYEKAETLRPPGNDEAILRWNTCVRLLQRYPQLQPKSAERAEAVLGE